jgi:hypothetical protein
VPITDKVRGSKVLAKYWQVTHPAKTDVAAGLNFGNERPKNSFRELMHSPRSGKWAAVICPSASNAGFVDFWKR